MAMMDLIRPYTPRASMAKSGVVETKPKMPEPYLTMSVVSSAPNTATAIPRHIGKRKQEVMVPEAIPAESKAKAV